MSITSTAPQADTDNANKIFDEDSQSMTGSAPTVDFDVLKFATVNTASNTTTRKVSATHHNSSSSETVLWHLHEKAARVETTNDIKDQT